MRVYISGGITGVENYQSVFSAAEETLKAQGCEVINPARTNATLPESFSHSEYMDVCFALLDKADAILMLPGYENSRGANQELGYARAKGKVVFSEVR